MSLRIRKVFSSEYEDTWLLQLHQLFLERKFCDVVLVAGNDNTRIPAHRIILSGSSDYFLELIRSARTPEIKLEDVDGDVLQIILTYIYSSYLELSADTVDRIMRTATQLNLKGAVAMCSDFLAARLTTAISLGVVVFSDQQDYPYMREKALMFASAHFMELLEEESFVQLEAEQLCLLIRRNDLRVKSEEDVFQALKIWLQHDRVNREKFFYKLLCNLRFPLLTSEFIAREVEKICQSPESQTLITKALKWHLSPTSGSILPPELNEPRNEIREIFVVSGISKEETTLIAEEFDPLVGVWNSHVELPPKPKPGWYSKGLFAAGNMYLAGTTVEGDTESSCVDYLNWTTKQFTELPSMTTSRHSFGMAAINGVLYAVGGTDGRNSLSVVEKWDPNLPEKWQEVAPMGIQRSQPAVAVLHGLLYAIGCNKNFASNSFEFYDPQTNTWAELTPPSQPRTAACLTAVNGYLYAVGGHTKLGICNMIERYDPKTNFWTKITSSVKHYQQSTASVNRLIALVDDEQGHSKHKFDEYDPETDEWRSLKSLEKSSGPIILISK